MRAKIKTEIVNFKVLVYLVRNVGFVTSNC